MNSIQARLLQFYSWVLRLYPLRFQEVYAEEMLLVFSMQLDNQPKLNIWRSLMVIYSELLPLPRLLVTSHLRERIKPDMKTGLERWFIQPQGSWKEALLAVLPFLLVGALPGILSLIHPGDMPLAITIPIVIILLLTPVILGVIGLLVGLPRWSLVYAGFLLTIMSVVPISLVRTFWTTATPFVVYYLVMLVLCFLLAAIMIQVSSKIPLTRDFSQQVKADSSLISLMLYGSASVLVLGMYEEATYLGMINQVLSSLALALGVWGFLRFERVAIRLGALIAGSTIALLFVQFASMEFSPPVLSIGFVVLVMICLPALVFREGIAKNAYPST